MSRSKSELRSYLVAPLLIVACAGTRLNDVGDISGEAGSGGAAEIEGGYGGKSAAMPSGGRVDVGGTSHGGSAGNAARPIAGDGGAPPTDDPIVEPPPGGGPPRGIEELECPKCEVLAVTPDIRDVATTADRVVWVEYGSFDELGNHRDDGRMVALPLDGGEPEVIASDLQAPIELELSKDFGYVVVERSGETSGNVQLIRLALDGGAASPIQVLPSTIGGPNDPSEHNWARRFASQAGAAYWAIEDTVYRLDEDAAAPAQVLMQTDHVFYLETDADQIYIQDGDGIKTLPFAGGSPTLIKSVLLDLGDPQYHLLTVSDGFVYARESSSAYLVRMPITGGSWKRIDRLVGNLRLIIDGDAYFMDGNYSEEPGYPIGLDLRQRSFTNGQLDAVLAIGPYGPLYGWRGWDISSDAVFFGYGKRLYRVARADL